MNVILQKVICMRYKIGQYIKVKNSYVSNSIEVIVLIIGIGCSGYLVSTDSKTFGTTMFNKDLAIIYNVPEKYWETRKVVLVFTNEVLGLSSKPKCLLC